MAALKDVTVEVTAQLTVSKETAERCLRLLEIYLDDNQLQRIQAHLTDAGRTKLSLVDMEG